MFTSNAFVIEVAKYWINWKKEILREALQEDLEAGRITNREEREKEIDQIINSHWLKAKKIQNMEQFKTWLEDLSPWNDTAEEMIFEFLEETFKGR